MTFIDQHDRILFRIVSCETIRPTERLNAGHNDVRVGAGLLPGFLDFDGEVWVILPELVDRLAYLLVGVAHEQQALPRIEGQVV